MSQEFSHSTIGSSAWISPSVSSRFCTAEEERKKRFAGCVLVDKLAEKLLLDRQLKEQQHQQRQFGLQYPPSTSSGTRNVGPGGKRPQQQQQPPGATTVSSIMTGNEKSEFLAGAHYYFQQFFSHRGFHQERPETVALASVVLISKVFEQPMVLNPLLDVFFLHFANTPEIRGKVIPEEMFYEVAKHLPVLELHDDALDRIVDNSDEKEVDSAGIHHPPPASKKAKTGDRSGPHVVVGNESGTTGTNRKEKAKARQHEELMQRRTTEEGMVTRECRELLRKQIVKCESLLLRAIKFDFERPTRFALDFVERYCKKLPQVYTQFAVAKQLGGGGLGSSATSGSINAGGAPQLFGDTPLSPADSDFSVPSNTPRHHGAVVGGSRTLLGSTAAQQQQLSTSGIIPMGNKGGSMQLRGGGPQQVNAGRNNKNPPSATTLPGEVLTQIQRQSRLRVLDCFRTMMPLKYSARALALGCVKLALRLIAKRSGLEILQKLDMLVLDKKVVVITRLEKNKFIESEQEITNVTRDLQILIKLADEYKKEQQ
ncbi:unnamed protein product [Amoebophrya sp. A120]|nr:unnamed protein product [Amoebophrya sp. A120]|eukprot:GSA120T00014923001.1